MSSSTLQVGSRTLTVSNLNKVLYPARHFTKAQALDYYIRVAPFLLPHLHNRPVTLVRFPDGVGGKSFYEKNAPAFTPDWVKRFPVPRKEGTDICYILINDLPTLAWTTNLAALELHPFLHRAPKIDRPTHLVFDLDPGDGVDVLGCAAVGFLLRDLLAPLKLQCFPKVSGSKGLQVYVPLNTAVTYESTRGFAESVAGLLHQKFPDRIVAHMSKAQRKGRVFIDWSQNHSKKTTVAVYSLRAKRDTPYVSMPVTWDELARAVQRGRSESLFFEPDAALRRLEKEGDLFQPVLTLKQKLPRSFATVTDAALSPIAESMESAPAPKRRPARAIRPSSSSSSSDRSIRTYADRRDFSQTAEPPASVPKRRPVRRKAALRFVVQKHAASHLHYDFRLELDGVLKSWAVPKGVPLIKAEKRGAFATEDHPLDYARFEGIIPQGQYGGGTVMVWDIGTYETVEGGPAEGRWKFQLKGKKLRGEWTLVWMKSSEDDRRDNAWLLIKTDADAPRIPLRKLDRSAVTTRTMEAIAAEKKRVWNSHATATASGRRKT